MSCKPSFIFVASSFRNWHGLDLILTAFLEQNNFKLTIVGKVFSKEMLLLERSAHLRPDDLTYYDYQSNCELVDLYSRHDLGISSLALSRNGMQEACPLKSREYLKNGLPVVGSYEDPEVKAPYYQCISPSGDALILSAHNASSLASIQVKEYARTNLSRSIYLSRLN